MIIIINNTLGHFFLLVKCPHENFFFPVFARGFSPIPTLCSSPDEGDDAHLALALGTDQRVDLIEFANHLRSAASGESSYTPRRRPAYDPVLLTCAPCPMGIGLKAADHDCFYNILLYAVILKRGVALFIERLGKESSIRLCPYFFCSFAAFSTG